MKRWECHESLVLPSTMGLMRVGVSQPGNGTKYTVVAVRWHAATAPRKGVVDGDPVPLGMLGATSDGWLVTVCQTIPGHTYLLASDGYLETEYLAKKLKLSEADAPHVIELIGRLLGRTTEYHKAKEEGQTDLPNKEVQDERG